MTTDDSSGHGFLPAIRDRPQGFGEASWWPFITAMGAGLLYLGFTAVVLANQGHDLVGWPVALAVTAGGAGTFVGGLAGWVYHAFVKSWLDHPSHNDGRSLRIGMILFLLTDVATFGAVYAYYLFVRVEAWPPTHLPADLLGAVLVVNTLLLVTSSLTYHRAERRLAAGDHRGFVLRMAATLGLGALFVGGQALEYRALLGEGFALESGVFGSAFFGLTGLHGLHVVLGVLLIGLVVGRAWRGQFDADRHVAVTTVGWYWHFVDGVWLVLVTTLYLGAALGTAASPL